MLGKFGGGFDTEIAGLLANGKLSGGLLGRAGFGGDVGGKEGRAGGKRGPGRPPGSGAKGAGMGEHKR